VLWPIASFRCDAEFDRYRGIADNGQARTNQAPLLALFTQVPLVPKLWGPFL
jgi:hypothetical protein